MAEDPRGQRFFGRPRMATDAGDPEYLSIGPVEVIEDIGFTRPDRIIGIHIRGPLQLTRLVVRLGFA